MTSATLRPHRHRLRSRTQLVRRLVQAAFLVFIILASLRHMLFEETTTAASIDALCPFGGIESLWRMLTTGEYVAKTHPSNLLLMTGLILATLVAGAAFCGWICPFGTLQDFLTWLRERMRLPAIRVLDGIDRWLRYGRFVMLVLVIYMTVSTVKLWFGDYDPYRTIFGLGWIFEFNAAEQWPAYTIALGILAASFFIPRFWCKYACPLGGALSLVSHVSFLRIRRSEVTCKSCALCSRPCPMGIVVEKADPLVSTNCIGCLECVDVCPRHAALEVALMPSLWWQTVRGAFRRPAPVTQEGIQMKVNKWFVPVLALAFLLGTVGVAQATGWWIVSGKSMVDVANMASSADVKGWMTFQQIIDGFGIEKGALYAALDLPADLSPETALKEMESVLPDFEVSTVRDVIAVSLGVEVAVEGESAPENATHRAAVEGGSPVATVTPIPEQSSTPAAVEHVPVGDRSGTGSGPAAPTSALEIKGRHTLHQVADATDVSLDDLLAALNLPPDTDPGTEVRSLVESGKIAEVDTIRTAVTERLGQ